MAKSYNYYKDILEANGYKEKYQESMNGVPTSVDFLNDKNMIITLGVQPTDDYIKELEKLPNGTKYIPDFNRFEGVYAWFGCSICNVSGFMDGDKSGIMLKENGPIRESLLDILGGDEYQEYYPHKMDLFEKCIWIQNHVMEHERNILEAHLKNLTRFKEEFDPILSKLDFYQYYSSVFDCTPDNDCERPNSNIFIYYKHKVSELVVDLGTDCITGDIVFNNKKYTADDLESLIKDKLFTRNGIMDVEYRYLYDSDYTPEVAHEVFKAYDILNYGTVEGLKTINLSIIPAKDYQRLIDRINEKLTA